MRYDYQPDPGSESLAQLEARQAVEITGILASRGQGLEGNSGWEAVREFDSDSALRENFLVISDVTAILAGSQQIDSSGELALTPNHNLGFQTGHLIALSRLIQEREQVTTTDSQPAEEATSTREVTVLAPYQHEDVYTLDTLIILLLRPFNATQLTKTPPHISKP